MKKSSLVISKVQMEITTRDITSPQLDWLPTRTQTAANADQDVKDRECKLVLLVWNTVWRFLRNLKVHLASLLLGMWTKEIKSAHKSYLHSHVYSSLIHNNQDRESTRCPSINKENVVYIHTMDHYSSIKKNKILAFATK